MNNSGFTCLSIHILSKMSNILQESSLMLQMRNTYLVARTRARTHTHTHTHTHTRETHTTEPLQHPDTRRIAGSDTERHTVFVTPTHHIKSPAPTANNTHTHTQTHTHTNTHTHKHIHTRRFATLKVEPRFSCCISVTDLSAPEPRLPYHCFASS